MQLTDLITAAKACVILGVTRQTLSNMVADGRAEVVLELDNGYQLFDRRAIDALADQRRAETLTAT